MNKNELIFDKEAREKLKEGVNKIAKVASATMGQQGNYTILKRPFGSPKVTKDGYYSIKDIELKDEQENQGAQLLKEGAKKSADEAGDGTTTCCVLTREIVNSAVNMIESGSSRTDISRGIDIAVKIVVEKLKEMSKPVKKGSKMIEDVATISANNNAEIGKQIADAMGKIKENGVVVSDRSNTLDSYVDVVEGMKIDRGYLSPYFVTDAESMECVLENPYIILFDDIISGIKPMLRLLEEATKQGRGVLVIAKEVNNEALATLIHNKVKGGAPFACINAPGYGEGMRDELEDVAMVTGGTVISETTGTSLETSSLEMLGEAKKVIIRRNETTFVGGKGNKKLIKTRITAIKNILKNIKEPYAREIIEKRLANIDGGVAVFYVGGATETEVEEKMDLIEDAIASTRAALEMGVVPGGGSSLVHAARSIDSNVINKGERAGMDIVRLALFAPLQQIMKNAGESSEVILDNVMFGDIKNCGYNLNTRKYCDMIKEGILDTTKVEISALQNAASVARMILMGATVITDEEEHK